MTRIISYIIIIIAAQLNVYAQEYGPTVKDATQRLEILSKACNNQKTIVADFIQQKRLSLMSDTQTSTGKFYYKNEGSKICLDYTNPQGNKIIMANDMFSIVTNGKKTTIGAKQNPAMAQLSSMIEACMTGDLSKLGKKAEMAYYETDDLFTIVIKPTNSRVKRHLREIVLRFSKKDNTLCIMKMTESNGDYQQYEYTNKIINEAIDGSHFTL